MIRLPRLTARSIEIGELLDTFLVCSVAMILVIRLQLYLTNYPQLGGHGLHIAHVLWGGLLMMVAIVVAVSFITRTARQVAAVVGGIGFGFFIDELGKFITEDVNYFYKPTAALIYIIFIGMWLSFRALQRHRGFSQRKYLVNAIELIKERPSAISTRPSAAAPWSCSTSPTRPTRWWCRCATWFTGPTRRRCAIQSPSNGRSSGCVTHICGSSSGRAL
jgi:hypothetical protein